MRFNAKGSLAALLLFSIGLGGCDEVILNELDELRANKVKVILAGQGIEAHKVRAGTRWNIAVDENQVTAALRTIDSSRLLARELSRTKVETGGLFRTREEKEQQLALAISEELCRTLEGLPGVLEAHVHLFKPPMEPLTGFPRPGSASVVAVVDKDCEIKISALAEIVAGATGIDAKRITVELLPQVPVSQLLEPSGNRRAESSAEPELRSRRGHFGAKEIVVLTAFSALPVLFFLYWRSGRTPKPLPPPQGNKPKLKPRNPETGANGSILYEAGEWKNISSR